MAKVKLGDVARESKLSYKGDKSGMKIVGLEHLTPENVTLSNWAENVENTFTKSFKKGQVLFGRRRAYLKKAVVAPFDGICSGDITVIEAIPGKINADLLPFIIQNDNLFAYAVENSAGSLSPRVKWEHLKDYEFDLPDMAEQERLAKILWAAEDVKQKYNAAIQNAVLMKRSLFEKYFNKESKLKLEDCIVKIIGGGTPSRSSEENFIGEIPWATVKDIADTDLFKSVTQEYINETAIKSSATNLIDANSLIIATRISLERSFINTVPMCINQDLKALVLKENMYAKYVYYWHKANIEKILQFASGTTVLGIRMEHLKGLSIVVPDYGTQVKIAETLSVIDEEILRLKSNISNLSDVIRQITNSIPRRDNLV